MSFRPRWIIFALPLLLTACGGLLPRAEPLDIYRLPPAASLPGSDVPDSVKALQLRVDSPHAAGLVASKRIVIMPRGNEVSIYHGARWSQPAPELLRDRLIRAFRKSGQLHAVFSDDSGLHADFVLSGTLDAFQAENRGEQKPVVVIDYDALLLRGSDVVANRQFRITVPASASAIPAVVDTFGKASDQLAGQVKEWVFSQMTKSPAAPLKSS